MVAKTKKYLITKESHEIFIVRRNGNKGIRGFCPECKAKVEMLTLDAATTNTGRRTRELFQLIENNLLHSIETTTGHLLVCQDSLRKQGVRKVKNTIKFLTVIFILFAGLSGIAYAGTITKSFEFGAGTANESSARKYFAVPCLLNVTATVKFKRNGDGGASDDIPILIELHNPALIGEENGRGDWEESVAKRSQQIVTLDAGGYSYGCHRQWSVRVKPTAGKSPFAITGDITLSFNDSQSEVSIEGNQITIEEGNQVTKNIGNSSGLRQGTITIKVIYAHKTARLKVELLNGNGVVVASQTGSSSNTPIGNRINLTYTNADCHPGQGQWTIRFTNNGDDKIHEMVPTAKFTPKCPN